MLSTYIQNRVRIIGRVTLVVMLLSVFLVVGNTYAAGLDDHTLLYKGKLSDEKAKPLVGYFDIRVSMWSTAEFANEDFSSKYMGAINVNSPKYLGFMEQQTLRTNSNGEFQLKIGQTIPFPSLPAQMKQVYFQIAAKPQGTSYVNWETIDTITSTAGKKELIPFETKYIPTATPDRTQFGEFTGTLLDAAGKPYPGKKTVRFSLWRSSNVDEKNDRMDDGSLNTSSSNFLGYESSIDINPDAKGVFKVPMGTFQFFKKELLEKKIFLQVEVKNQTDPVKSFEIIDPDGDLRTDFDRSALNESGRVIATTGGLSSLGSSGKWVVSQIPNGTSENVFEIGAGGTDTQAIIELRANQGTDKKGVLRFNGSIKQWEISSDGIHFCVIGECTFLKGTKNDTFTIGLGNETKGPLGLIFGDTYNAHIDFDPAKNAFVFSKSIDLDQNELRNAVLDRRAKAPTNPVQGQLYFNTTDQNAYIYDGTTWKSLSGGVTNSYTSVFGGSSGGTTIVQGDTDSNGTTSSTYTINKNNTAGDVNLKFGTSPGQLLKWDTINQYFDFGKGVNVNGNVSTTGDVNVGGTNMTLDHDNTGSGVNLSIIANQGTNPDGILRYNATTQRWEISNGGGGFNNIVDSSTAVDLNSSQTLTNKTIDGNNNTLTNIDFSSMKPRSKTLTFDAEYWNSATNNTGANKGVLRVGRDAVNNKNYYSWTTSQNALNMIELSVPIRLPDDFVSFDATPITLDYRTEGTALLDHFITVFVKDTTNTPVTLTGAANLVSTIADNWATASVAFTGAPTFTPGSTMTISVQLNSKSLKRAQVGQLLLHYQGR